MWEEMFDTKTHNFVQLPSDIFEVWSISHIFNLQSPKTILWTFVMFSVTTTDFWRPERLASSMLYNRVQMRHTSRWLLISLVQSSHNAYQATALIQQYLFPLKSNVWLTLETFLIHCFENDKSWFTKTSVTFELNVKLSWNFGT